MEVPFPVQKPLLRSRTVANGRAQLIKITPFLGFLPHGTTSLSSQSFLWSKGYGVADISHRITASADFSRRRQRRISTPRTQDSSPKGFVPRTQVGTSTQRRDQKNNGEKEGPRNLPPNDLVAENRKRVEVKQTIKEQGDDIEQVKEEEYENEVDNIAEEEPSLAAEITNVVENAINRSVDEDLIETDEVKGVVKGNKVDDHLSGTSLENQPVDAVANNEPAKIDESKQLATIKNSDVNQIESIEILKDTSEEELLKSEPVQKEEKDDSSLKLKLELEANLRKQALERLAEENFEKGSRLFYYPELVKSDEDVEVFLNRSLSTLNNEPEVLIMGAFNDWRWKSFTMKMNKTNISGDWWACQVHVPKEAYKMDFVFFNGKDVYDNNDKKDFCITIEGGMTLPEFENFLLEEKHKELEKLAKEEAERKRQAEELKQIEAQKAAREADRAQAREEAARRRQMLKEWIKKAVKSVDDVWHIEPSDFKGGDKVILFYNKSSGPLIHAKELWLHGGYNKWKDGPSIVTKLARFARKDGDWWYAEIVVPDRALVLDWVFADGPPQQARIYDNNDRGDFHAIVPRRAPEDRYWVEEEDQIYLSLQEERRFREKAIRAKAEKTAQMKAETKERTLRNFLLSQKHIVYTEPFDVQAGSTANVFYNPANTVLNGKAEIWFRCSFNRWTHRMGPLPPQRMLPAENGSHVKATVMVPLDAYMMDFVFSEKKDGGIYDNKNGMDYHIPVFGGVIKEPPMHIVHIAVEMAPIAKVGGLGDVVTSLSRAVQDLNHSVDIVLPKYNCLNLSHVKDFQFHKSYWWGGTEIKVWFGKVEGISVYFLEPQNGLCTKENEVVDQNPYKE